MNTAVLLLLAAAHAAGKALDADSVSQRIAVDAADKERPVRTPERRANQSQYGQELEASAPAGATETPDVCDRQFCTSGRLGTLDRCANFINSCGNCPECKPALQHLLDCQDKTFNGLQQRKCKVWWEVPAGKQTQLRPCPFGKQMSVELEAYLDDVWKAKSRWGDRNLLWDVANGIPDKKEDLNKARTDAKLYFEFLAEAKTDLTGYHFQLQYTKENLEWGTESDGETPKAYMKRVIEHIPGIAAPWNNGDPATTFLHLLKNTNLVTGLYNYFTKPEDFERVYVSCSVDDVMSRAAIFKEVMKIMATEHQKYKAAKIAGPGENRRDCIVVWTTDPVDFVKQMLVVEVKNPEWFGDSPPRLVRQVSRAMGLAAEPKEKGFSFSSWYYAIIEEAMEAGTKVDLGGFKQSVIMKVKAKGGEPCNHERLSN